jgi:hypothetical protein
MISLYVLSVLIPTAAFAVLNPPRFVLARVRRRRRSDKI